MKAPKTISPLSVVPAQDPAPVKRLLSPEEKQLLDLLADIVIKDIFLCKQKKAESLSSKPTTE